MSDMKKIVIIGQGNVAWHLTEALGECDGCEIKAVNSHTLDGLTNDSDLYIIAVSDTAIKEVAEKIPVTKGIVAHTSGSISLECIDPKHSRRGVIYPLQTFTKGRKLNYSEIPFFLEAESPTTLSALREIIKPLGVRCIDADSEQRRMLHLASVFVCNFANRLFGIGEDLLEKSGLPGDSLHALINETVKKLSVLSPREAQTGPARRGDGAVLERHIAMLKDMQMTNESEIYRLLSESISNEFKHSGK